MKKGLVGSSLMIGFTLLWSVSARAQEPDVPSKIEVGVHFSSLTPNFSPDFPFGRGLSATAGSGAELAGFGGRFTFNLTKYIALEAETNFFPRDNYGDFLEGGRMLQGQFGVKAGKRLGKFGIFLKARPGFASFSKVFTQVGTITIDVNGQPVTFANFDLRRKTHFSMDLGGVIEFYPSRKVLTRIDIGDTIIHSAAASSSPSVVTPFIPVSRTSHNFQVAAGIGFRLGSIQPADATQARQEKKQKFEVGAQFSSLSFTDVIRAASPLPAPPSPVFYDTRAQAGFGGRLTYNVTPNFALETQGDFFPRDMRLFNNLRAGGRALQGQAGIKIGKRLESVGIFAKARPGVVSFSKTLKVDGFDTTQLFPVALFHLERRTYFSLDLGGVLEFYPSPRVVARFDGGDTMIRYGRIELPFPGSETLVTLPETIHSFQFSAGVGLRF
jgi:hypothetical protein